METDGNVSYHNLFLSPEYCLVLPVCSVSQHLSSPVYSVLQFFILTCVFVLLFFLDSPVYSVSLSFNFTCKFCFLVIYSHLCILFFDLSFILTCVFYSYLYITFSFVYPPPTCTLCPHLYILFFHLCFILTCVFYSRLYITFSFVYSACILTCVLCSCTCPLLSSSALCTPISSLILFSSSDFVC